MILIYLLTFTCSLVSSEVGQRDCVAVLSDGRDSGGVLQQTFTGKTINQRKNGKTLIDITQMKTFLNAQLINTDLTRKLNEKNEIFSFFVVLYQCCCCQENVFKKIAF